MPNKQGERKNFAGFIFVVFLVDTLSVFEEMGTKS